MAHIVNRDVVVLTPEKWHICKYFAAAENVSCGRLPLPLGDHPVLNPDPLTGPAIWPAGDVAGRKNPGRAGLQIFVDDDAPVDRQAGLSGQGRCRTDTHPHYDKVRVEH